jgi:hypothetical protein
MSLASQNSQYQLSPTQSNFMSAPMTGEYFAQQDQVFTTDNSSVNAPFGTSTRDQISYDSAGYQFFNNTMYQKVDCSRVNSAAGRPNVGPGQGCYPASVPAQRAAVQMDANYGVGPVTASQLVLAQGDLLYAPARFADQNNYMGPSISDNTYQPRLLGSKDVVPSGCSTSQVDQTFGGVTMCGVNMPFDSDPRTAYGVDSPTGGFWDRLAMGGADDGSCVSVGGSSACSLGVLGTSRRGIPEYTGPSSIPVGAPRNVRVQR